MVFSKNKKYKKINVKKINIDLKIKKMVYTNLKINYKKYF
jgi:hypothetical protein